MQPDRQQQLDQQWLDALLTQAYHRDAQVNERIAAVMQQLDRPLAAPATRSHWYSMRNLTALAIAASLLLLATLLFDNRQQLAYAAVARSAQPAPKIRHYKLTMINQRPGVGQRTGQADLYFDTNQRFVMKSPGMLGFGTLWIGGDTEQRWIAPPRGPVVIGDEESVGRWLTGHDIASPYLHLRTILDRMAHAYRLTMLPDELLTNDDAEVMCSHVRGEIRQWRPFLPLSIELWANRETGMAHRVILQWPTGPNRRGPVNWTIELLSTPDDLPKDWFDLAGHAAGRKIIRARTDQDIEQNVERLP